jgi:hypothetical protein
MLRVIIPSIRCAFALRLTTSGRLLEVRRTLPASTPSRRVITRVKVLTGVQISMAKVGQA